MECAHASDADAATDDLWDESPKGKFRIDWLFLLFMALVIGGIVGAGVSPPVDVKDSTGEKTAKIRHVFTFEE